MSGVHPNMRGHYVSAWTVLGLRGRMEKGSYLERAGAPKRGPVGSCDWLVRLDISVCIASNAIIAAGGLLRGEATMLRIDSHTAGIAQSTSSADGSLAMRGGKFLQLFVVIPLIFTGRSAPILTQAKPLAFPFILMPALFRQRCNEGNTLCL